ncbi:glycosyltransferase family 87 protein [Celeribacter sp.]|uniref:glycosyltransferase family 87 protein n=1 Tax=Celeribacter sp. TaxID=1890673 RepID=UPI003A8D7B24
MSHPSFDPPAPRLPLRLWVLQAVLAVGFIYTFVSAFWDGWPADLSALYFAAKSVAIGTPEIIYAAPPDFFSPGTPPEWRDLAVQLGVQDRVILPYLYPPIWAYALAPVVDHVAPAPFFNVVLIVQMAMLAALPAIGYAIARPREVSAQVWLLVGYGLLALSAPSLGAIIQNQPQIAVTFIVMLSILCATRDRPVAAGILMGLAAAIKLQPALFGLVFLIHRDWRAAIAMSVSALSLLVLSILVAGVDLHLAMLSRLDQINGMVVYTKVNYALESLLYHLHAMRAGIPLPDGRTLAVAILDAPAWVEWIPKLLLLVGLATLVRKGRAMSAPALWLSLTLLGALFGPLSWGHYFILPLMLLPALFHVFSTRAAWAWLAVIGVLFSYPVFSALIAYNQTGLVSIVPPLIVMLALGLRLLTARPPAA